MPDPRACMEVRRRLARHGLPLARIDRVVHELAGHWTDLHDGGLEAGLSPDEARAKADERLGAPERLAGEVIAGFRESSTLGRHPILALCVLPLLLPLALMAVVGLPLYWLAELTDFMPLSERGPAPSAELAYGTLWIIYYASLFLSTAWLCRRSWRAGLGVRWIVAICLWCALAALVRFFDADSVRRNVTLGLSFPWRLNLHTAVVLCVHAIAAGWFMIAARKAAATNNNNNETGVII
jgi:hypothetical protein